MERKGAGTICYLVDGKHVLFLLLRSAKLGEWGPPKGYADPHESEMETALRELYEEAGIRKAVFLPSFREEISYEVKKKSGNYTARFAYYLCRMDTDEIKLSPEHTEAHLGTIDEVEQLVPHENVKVIFRKALEAIKKSATTKN